MIKGIIFDLDGTLIDSMGMWAGIDREFLRENGIYEPPSDISDRIRKMPIEESSAYFIELFDLKYTVREVIDRIEELVRIRYESIIELKPHVIEILDFLDEKNIPYGIATATYRSLAEVILKRHGIYDRFKFILTDREYPKGKSYPDIFLGAAEILGFSPENILVIEDSLHCIETAKKAGFKAAGVYDDFSAADRDKIISTADYYVNSLDELMNIF